MEERVTIAATLIALLALGVPALAASAACAGCHRAIYNGYRTTPMARSARSVRGAPFPERFDRASFEPPQAGYRYRISASDGRYTMDLINGDGPIASKSLAYAVGSGVRAFSYLFSDNGYLYEAPVAYYTASGSWGLAPGFALYGYPFLTRPVMPACLACHATGIQADPVTVNRYSSPPFLEGGVACERCHGNGDRHVAQMRSGKRSGDPLILNPAKLEASRRDSICSGCHLSGDVPVMRPGHDWRSFRPGDKLSDHEVIFVRAGMNSAVKVTGHVESLALSACKRGAGDRLWCGSCHDPHSEPTASQTAAYFRNRCLSCHETKHCTAPRAIRAVREDDCITCHMPKAPASDAEHTVFTDHSIPRRPRTLKPLSGSAASAELIPFGGAVASPRDLALAYAYAAVGRSTGADHERALSLLPPVAKEDPRDVEVLVSLAELYRVGGQNELARPLYEHALASDPGNPTASVGLGGILMESGDLPGAIRLWTAALAKNEGLEFVRLNLVFALWKSGDNSAWAAVLARALELNPAFVPARELLRRIQLAENARTGSPAQ